MTMNLRDVQLAQATLARNAASNLYRQPRTGHGRTAYL